MNQKYKDKYEELRNNDLGAKHSNDDTNPKEEETYATPDNVRNIGFIWEDGRKMFFNYAYLISVELQIDEDRSTLILNFTTHIIKINGYKLEKLFDEVFAHKVRIIPILKNRYYEETTQHIFVTQVNLTAI